MVDASVRIWGKTIGAVSWDEQQQTGIFEYEPGFLSSGLDLSPIMMGLDEARRGQAVYSFPNLKRDTYRGLPGLLADSLPDNFGNRIIDEWLSRQGRDPETFSPIERLCYTGQRGMGALEFEPALNPNLNISSEVNVDRLLVLAGEILSNRKDFRAKVDGKHDEEAMLDILRVATSAGGARAKALIAKNDSTGEIRSGQVPAPEGFRYWLLKFDGVQDRNLERTANYGRLEYAYYKMAVDCGINMTECRLLEENNRPFRL